MAWAVNAPLGHADDAAMACSGARSSAAAIAAASSVSPRRRTATVGTTGTPSRLRKRCGIDHQPVTLGQIEHVERDHRGPAQRDHFLRKDQMLFKIGRIEHHHQHFAAPLRRETRQG